MPKKKNQDSRFQDDERHDELLVEAGYRYALALTQNIHDAEDLVQDAWLKWSEARDKGRRPDMGDVEHARAYFLTIVRNTFIDSHREGRRIIIEPLNPGRNEPASGDDGDDEQYSATPAEVREALGSLGVAEREALFLSAYEGLTAREIAERTNTSRGTILSRLGRGREKLARLLAGMGGGEARKGGQGR